ncbi:MAG TPA: ABC transporter ATP-binding protein [Burkholderiales bacterium]|nr:ABC transporter ATP-binding protein [Burkholderiales bacterium]
MSTRESAGVLGFSREVFAFAGAGGLATLALMTLVAVSEGAGIVLLVPLLALVGIAPQQQLPAWTHGLLDGDAGPGGLYLVLAVFLGLLAARQLLLLRQNERVARLRFRFVNHIRRRVLEALMQVQWRYLSRGMLQRQAQVLTLDVNRIGEACELLFRLGAAALFLAMQVTIAAVLAPGFTALALGSMILTQWLLRRRLVLASHRGDALTQRHNALFVVLSNLKGMLRITRMTGASQRLLDTFERETGALAEQAVAYARDHEWGRILVHLAGAAVLCVALVAGVEVFALDAVEILLLVVIFARLIPQLAGAQQMLHRLFHALSAYEHAARSVELLRDRCESAAGAMHPVQPPARVALEDIVAGYDDEAGGPVLRGAALCLGAGEVVALTGDSGSGKSTLADVLAGLLEPLSGRIVLDGIPLDAGRLPAWRRAVGYVEQDAALLTGTLLENLTFGTGEQDPRRIARALGASLSAEFVAALPDGLATHVGEHGSRLSGGQRQRVALARELLREPLLLVLDEATSGLDAETEARVFEQLRRHYPSLTILVITHRTSAIGTMDRLLEMRGGQVHEAPRVPPAVIRERRAAGPAAMLATTAP